MRVRSIVAACALLVLAGCGRTGPGAATEPPFLVVVLQPSGVEDPIELVSSSALGVDLAIREAVALGRLPEGSGLRVVEVGPDAEAEVRELAGEDGVVAAVATPFADAPEAEHALTHAGVPVFSLSWTGGAPTADVWHRLVPDGRALAAELERAAGPAPCVAGTSIAEPPLDVRRLGDDDPRILVDDAERVGCTGFVWLGDADGALELANAVADARADLPLVVTAAARVDRFAAEGYPHAVGTVAVTPCPDLAHDVADAARAFVHAYQAAHGVPPGLCAAEGYGLGGWLVERGSRSEVLERVLALDTLPYPGGAIVVDARPPGVERVVGVRWLRVDET